MDIIKPNEQIEVAPAAALRNIGVRASGYFWGRLLDRDKREVPGSRFVLKNAATTAGLNYLLDTAFRGVTQVTTWYIGLMDNSGFSAVAAGDTMSSHAGWSEFTSYSGSNRIAWTPSAAASGQLVSSAATSFTISADGTLKGMFLSSGVTKGGSTGTLWATALETSTRAVANGQTLQVYYTNTMTPVS